MIRLCSPHELTEGQSRGFVLNGLRLLAVRRAGRVYAYENRCPHRGVPLEWQADRFLDETGTLLQCAHHGALFSIESGECVSGPCQGQELNLIPCEENAEGIWVDP
ncbi:MAG TPA: Rieske (2Fe-2S) protein [Pseudomonas sp.]|nr:Rieske (2Fe-2S) protein [Pseudomonas sp.]